VWRGDALDPRPKLEAEDEFREGAMGADLPWGLNPTKSRVRAPKSSIGDGRSMFGRIGWGGVF